MSDQLKWYVVRANKREREKGKAIYWCRDQPLRYYAPGSAGIDPNRKILQMRDGKKIAKERNFFPGYVLMEAQLDAEIEHIIKNITAL